MKLKEREDYAIIKFTESEKKSGLIDHLIRRMPIFGIQYSKDKLTWKVADRNLETLLALISKYKNSNRQTNLFD